MEPATGLTSDEAAERLARYGPNRFAEARTESRWHAFLRQYQDPMQIVLVVAGVISIYPVKQAGTGIVILLLTLLNAALGRSQEGKAAAAVAALAKMMIVKARVRRDGALMQLPAEQLVPGDVVAIEAGDVVPADGRVLAAATLEIAEAALTGESLPVSKGVELVEAPATPPLGDELDMVYMNTNVTRGTGELVVTSTGMATEVGHISGMLQGQDESKSPLTVQLEKLTKQLVTIAGLALVASVALNMARGQSFTEVFTVAVAFAIAAIPTGLPAVVTTILSRGTRLLADANAIVKRLRSTETLGATSAICSDKTGTLTLNQMTAVELMITGDHLATAQVDRARDRRPRQRHHRARQSTGSTATTPNRRASTSACSPASHPNTRSASSTPCGHRGETVGDDRRRRQRRPGAQGGPTSASPWGSRGPTSPKRPPR